MSGIRFDIALVPGCAAADVARQAADAEAAGYGGLWAAEAAHDPFLPLAVAASSTSSIALATGIAVALSRSPMHLAYLGNDLQVLSGGRFTLGLGSQVRAHIERRFSATWSQPTARMAELVRALRDIWSAWHERRPLRFEGRFYRHTLMPPLFDPGPNPHGPPTVLLAAVGTRMTEIAGEVGDGLCAHSFTTPTYLRDVSWPALRRGAAVAGRTADELVVSLPVLVATGRDDTAMDISRAAVRRTVAFYASTPAYLGVLAAHGWETVHTEANRLAREQRWDELAAVIDDEVLDAFAVVAEPSRVGEEIVRRFDGLVNRVSLATPYDIDAATATAVLDAIGSRE